MSNENNLNNKGVEMKNTVKDTILGCLGLFAIAMSVSYVVMGGLR